MNHKFFKTAAVKAMSIAATVIVLASVNPSGSYANNGKEKASKIMSDDKVSVSYVGTNNNSFVFHIEYDNPTNEKFTILVKNDAGIIVYQEQFTDARFSKNFRLPKEESEIRPTFIIRKGKEQVERSFVVNTKLTENIEVTKL